jgi:hypothetical protein
MTGYHYRITEAAVQLGDGPPYNLVNAPVRMLDDRPQIKVAGTWYDYPKDERRELPVKTLYGQTVAGIASSWEVDRPYEGGPVQ